MAKRTTHRSSKGTKLYAVRDKSGKFKDIQTYKRAHGVAKKRKKNQLTWEDYFYTLWSDYLLMKFGPKLISGKRRSRREA